uniref:Small ribosomal subunit protein uS19m n=1 Tax=Chloroparvula japonica TaxID=1411623 RepID=A0A4D6C6J5_9CHLO|nr:ribosomal protein S19 [Chloroparvula japonica]QBX98788.1 ribosomal protein S19 [Chloroparvula japonica]
MVRSVWKGPYVDPSVYRKAFKNQNVWTIYARQSVVLPEFVGQEVEVHNGHKFVSFRVTEYMVGHKFGEFASTRRKPTHKTKK